MEHWLKIVFKSSFTFLSWNFSWNSSKCLVDSSFLIHLETASVNYSPNFQNMFSRKLPGDFNWFLVKKNFSSERPWHVFQICFQEDTFKYPMDKANKNFCYFTNYLILKCLMSTKRSPILCDLLVDTKQ